MVSWTNFTRRTRRKRLQVWGQKLVSAEAPNAILSAWQKVLGERKGLESVTPRFKF